MGKKALLIFAYAEGKAAFLIISVSYFGPEGAA
jgi:hypothetical protein